MKKQTDVGHNNSTPKLLVDQFRCGECLHFKNSTHPAKNDLCSNLGIKKLAHAPRCFTPDVLQFTKINAETIPKIAVLLSNMSSSQKRILQGLLSVENRLKRTDFSFGSKVYFHLGTDHLDNYLSGYVVGRTSTKELIVVGSVQAHNRGQSLVAFFGDSTEILSVSDWKKRRKNLYDSGRLHAGAGKRKVKPHVGDNYEPPSLDKAPEHLLLKLKPKTKKGPKVKPLTGDVFRFS